MKLLIVPMTISDAQSYVDQHHRHHKSPRGGLFAVAVASSGEIRGVAIAGRPVARELQTGWTIEITRVCTDGTPNCCSMLYGACRRAAIALGYRVIVTYTLASESGSSLRAAGFRVIADVRGRSWSCPSRPRVDRAPMQDKLRWEAA